MAFNRIEGAGTPGTPQGGILTVQGTYGDAYGSVPVAITAGTITGSFSSTVNQGNPNASQSNAWFVTTRQVATASLTQVALSATSVSLVAANPNRQQLIIYNSSTTQELFVAYGSTASTTAFTYPVPPLATLEIIAQPCFNGAVSGIWAGSGSGNAIITEVSF